MTRTQRKGEERKTMTIDEEAAKIVTIRDEDGEFWIGHGGNEYILVVCYKEEAECVASDLRRLLNSFGRRCAEDMRERCVNEADIFWRDDPDPTCVGRQTAVKIKQALSRLEVK